VNQKTRRATARRNPSKGGTSKLNITWLKKSEWSLQTIGLTTGKKLKRTEGRWIAPAKKSSRQVTGKSSEEIGLEDRRMESRGGNVLPTRILIRLNGKEMFVGGNGAYQESEGKLRRRSAQGRTMPTSTGGKGKAKLNYSQLPDWGEPRTGVQNDIRKQKMTILDVRRRCMKTRNNTGDKFA